jgi:hypothetical protein
MTDIRIAPQIFEDHPTFRRGIVIAKNINHQGHSAALEDLLKGAIEQAPGHLLI